MLFFMPFPKDLKNNHEEDALAMEREEFLQVYRHSLAHILAKAVIEMFGNRSRMVFIMTFCCRGT